MMSKSSMVSSAKAGKGLLRAHDGDAAADVAGEGLDVFEGGELGLFGSGGEGEFFEVELGVAGDDGEEILAMLVWERRVLKTCSAGRPILRATEMAVRSSGSTS